MAHENDLCNKVLFLVPMDGNMASKLLLDAASNAPPREGKAEHPGDTPGIQTPAGAGAGSVAIPQEACKTSQGAGNTQRSVTVSVVTRSMSKKESNEKNTDVCEANPIAFEQEWERLAQIGSGFEEKDVLKDCIA